MFQITQLDNNPRQEITMLLEDNTRVVFSFEYKPNQMSWFFGVKYGENINYQNIRLTTAYNLLRAYRNYMPFGLRVDTADTEEPTDLNDFITGYAKVYLLNKKDIETVEANFYAKV